jgi:hypothetical protein
VTACRLAADRPTLLMFIHPRCPCTRASLGELEQLLHDCRGRLAAQVFVYRPQSAAPGWEQTDVYRTAASIPGVELRIDHDGAERDRFGARVSGETLLYDAAGRLRFHGGITAGRGHRGDNAGRDALEACVLSGAASKASAPVFGCTLASSDKAPSRTPSIATGPAR